MSNAVRYRILVLWVLALAIGLPAQAAPQVIESSAARVALLELYTSEGCSSCPPAEQWMSSLTGDTRLWSALVPVQFHVTYWDDLGWRDPFDSPLYTARQQQLSARAGHGTVYTPEFVLNGAEWLGWFDRTKLTLGGSSEPGPLTLRIDGDRVEADFDPRQPPTGPLVLNVAVLAFGVTTAVAAGENAGRTLRHDFLVVGTAHVPLARAANGFSGVLRLPKIVATEASRYALAGWVSLTGEPMPLQAAGGWLPGTP